MIDVLLFVLGAIFGSFLNVCITRLPLKKSIISPPSLCPNCQQRIKPYHNIPIISYLILGGKCYNCKWHIPIRYLLVELLGGGLLLLLYHNFKIKPLLFQYAILCFILIIITFIDIEYKLILNKIILPGFILGICFGLINRGFTLDILAGIICGAGILIFIAVLGKIIYKKQSMGGGDIKLAAMIGSYVGFNGVLISVMIAIISAAVVGLIISKLYKIKYIPFGPFLSLGTIIYIFNDTSLLSFLNCYFY